MTKTKKSRPTWKQLNDLVDGLHEVVQRQQDDMALMRQQHAAALKAQGEKLGKDRIEAGLKLVNALGQSVQASAQFTEAMARLAAGLTQSHGAF